MTTKSCLTNSKTYSKNKRNSQQYQEHKTVSESTTATTTIHANGNNKMNGFRISGFPSATLNGGLATAAQQQQQRENSMSTTQHQQQHKPANNTALGNANKLSSIVTGNMSNSNNIEVTYAKPYQLMSTNSNTTYSQVGSKESSLATTPNGGCSLNYMLDDELDLHIKESAVTITGNSALSMLQPSPPPLTTAVTTSATTAAPIALKGNNPFLNSPSPTDNIKTTTAFSFQQQPQHEIPEYAEPQRYRQNKQTPQQHPQSSIGNSGGYASTVLGSGAIVSIQGSVNVSTKETIIQQLTSPSSSTSSSCSSGFVDYSSSQQQQLHLQQQQLRQQQLTLQQQQRLLQLTRQQQQLRQAVSMVNSSGSSTASATTKFSDTTTSNNHVNMDKEAIYAALLQQYRQSPTQATAPSNVPHKALKTPNNNSSNSSYCPPVPLHRNINTTASTNPVNGPIVPRRSHSTPRPLSSNLSHASNPPLGPNAPNTTTNGQRPRSLERFNNLPANNKPNTPVSPYQPPPIPIRRFAPGTQPKRNVGSPQPSEAAKFQGKKSTSIDNIRQHAVNTSDVPPNQGTMRHSVTFHGRPVETNNLENGFSVEDLKSNCNQNNTNNWSKTERPMSYAFGGAGPDQAYLENQLRAYSEQLRTITESVRKYSEQAKLLSELKRQQHLAKQQQMGSTASVNNSQTNLEQTHNNQPIPMSKSTGNFSSSMISQEIVSKSLASLNNQTAETQSPSTQLKMFLDNIRSSMRSEYQQNIPEEVLKPIKEPKTTQANQKVINTNTIKRNSLVDTVEKKSSSPLKQVPQKPAAAITQQPLKEPESLPTPSDQLRLFLDAIRSNKIPENDEKPKIVNSQTLDSFITKPLQMPDVTSGTPGNNGPPSRRRPKSTISTTSNAAPPSQIAAPTAQGSTKLEHSLTTSESFHQISDNLRLMSEDLKALSPSKVVVNSHSSGSLKTLAAPSELRVHNSTSPLATSPTIRQNFPTSNSNSSICSLANSTNNTSNTSTPSTAPLMTDFNEILDSFQQMADKYKSKGSYDYLRKCSEALRQHSQQLKLMQQQQQLAGNSNNGFHNSNNGFNEDSNSCTTTPGSIREAVQNLLMQPRNGFQILDDRMRLFIDIIDSQDKLSQ
ncbi:dystrophin-like, partial [Lucilia sericata]|uniref:dystrophin-like n=1 Tax=Lucilia sericata TaxID=13632 RepID=UPI0018A8082D